MSGVGERNSQGRVHSLLGSFFDKQGCWTFYEEYEDARPVLLKRIRHRAYIYRNLCLKMLEKSQYKKRGGPSPIAERMSGQKIYFCQEVQSIEPKMQKSGDRVSGYF